MGPREPPGLRRGLRAARAVTAGSFQPWDAGSPRASVLRRLRKVRVPTFANAGMRPELGSGWSEHSRFGNLKGRKSPRTNHGKQGAELRAVSGFSAEVGAALPHTPLPRPGSRCVPEEHTRPERQRTTGRSRKRTPGCSPTRSALKPDLPPSTSCRCRCPFLASPVNPDVSRSDFSLLTGTAFAYPANSEPAGFHFWGPAGAARTPPPASPSPAPAPSAPSSACWGRSGFRPSAGDERDPGPGSATGG